MSKHKNSLYLSEDAKAELDELYAQKLASLDIDYQSVMIDTSKGKTHVLICGKESNPPLILIHGSNGTAPIALETYPNLTAKFRVYAVDVLAQPNRSAETRLSMDDLSYGEWINEIIEHFKLDRVTLAGFSFGGLIILKTLLHNESKIKAAYLAAPAYIVNGNPIVALIKVFVPMKRYIRKENPKHLQKFLKGLFTDEDTFALKFLAKVFKNFNMDFTPVPVIKTRDALGIKTPLTIFAAKQDIMFPGEKMLKRANAIFPSLKQAVLLPQSKHVQSRTDNELIEKSILSNEN